MTYADAMADMLKSMIQECVKFYEQLPKNLEKAGIGETIMYYKQYNNYWFRSEEIANKFPTSKQVQHMLRVRIVAEEAMNKAVNILTSNSDNTI